MRPIKPILYLSGIAALSMVVACEEEIPPPVYQLIPANVRDIIVSASAAGVVEPIQTVEVKSKASGEILNVAVETGSVVSRGDLLVRVDQRVPQNAVTQAEADLDVARAQLTNAESQLRRSEALFETQSITEQEYEDASLNHANARAQLVRAQRTLEDARIAFEDTEVRAPSRGVILGRSVEVGTVIQSASQGVSGGSVLLTMANLDTVQVRTLVDETDIGKINAGLPVTIRVDAFPNQPFQGMVLKIEPEALEEQNVTMFPVLVRIANPQGLLRPGMNSEVEIHIGSREGVLAVPNAALRTQRDVNSAAEVLGLDPTTVQEQLANGRQNRSGDQASTVALNGDAATGQDENTIEVRGQTVTLPNGVTRSQVQPILDKVQSDGFQSLSPDERSLVQRVFRAAGGRGGNRAGRRRAQAAESNFQFGGDYIVFVLRDGLPTAVRIRTGLTDLDFSEVVSGITAQDTVLVLPSAGLIRNQQQTQERIQRFTNNGLTGRR